MAKDKILFSKAHPDLAKEWYEPFNSVLAMSLEDTTETCGKSVYWQCPVCNSIYRMAPKMRAEKKLNSKESCFTCRGRVQRHCFIV